MGLPALITSNLFANLISFAGPYVSDYSYPLYRSYISAHVLLNLLKELGKRDKNFRNKFNIFNNTRAQMLDSIYHMTLR